MSRARQEMSESIRRVVRVYQAARHVDKRPDTGPESHLHPIDADAPLHAQMLRSLVRWVEMWEREIHGGGGHKLPTQDKVSAKRKAQTKAVLADAGLDATAVAFRHGLTTEGVTNLRTKHGLDPVTGAKVAT